MHAHRRTQTLRRTATVVLAAALLPFSCASEETADQAALQRSHDYDASPDPRTHRVMEAKLRHAHVLMDAIAVEDFPRIERNAEALAALSEQSDWFVHSTPTYRSFSEAFREATGAIVEHARAGSIEGVTADYVEMLSKCYECHRYLRREGTVRDMPGVISRLPVDQPQQGPGR